MNNKNPDIGRIDKCIQDTLIEIPISNGHEEVMATFISFKGLDFDKEHFAIGLGNWRDVKIPTVRIHSECMTGDVFMSRRCDCGEQLKEAINLLSVMGGIILYLRQEGRGIGLYSKFAAYKLQDEGYDTYEANQQLGFNKDSREFNIAAEMLKSLGRTQIHLHTNNMDKQDQLIKSGIDVVSVINTKVYENPHNLNYLNAKHLAGHKLNK